MAHIVSIITGLLNSAPPVTALALIALGIMLESMCVPIPSEVILITAGWYVAQGKFGSEGFLPAMIASTLGCLIGSSLAYAVGYYGGKSVVERYGQYILLTPHRIEMGERWLARFGPAAIMAGRLMFAIRALISFPVGILRMGYRRFILSTLIGGAAWNAIGIYLGYLYGPAMERKLHDMSVGMFALLAAGVLGLAALYFWKTHLAGGDSSPGEVSRTTGSPAA